MRKNKLILIIPFLTIFLMSTGGGKGSGGGKNGTFGDSNTCDTVIIPLTLFQGNIDPSSLPRRSQAYFTFQPTMNILNGGQATSPPNLFLEDIKSYCHITITANNCSNYGNGGTRTYIWDSTNDGNSNDSSMLIEAPSDSNFTITIDLHEGCGPWYDNFTYRRAMWIHQGNYSPTNFITVSNWLLNRIDNC